MACLLVRQHENSALQLQKNTKQIPKTPHSWQSSNIQKQVIRSCNWLYFLTVNINFLYSVIQLMADHCGQHHAVIVLLNQHYWALIAGHAFSCLSRYQPNQSCSPDIIMPQCFLLKYHRAPE